MQMDDLSFWLSKDEVATPATKTSPTTPSAADEQPQEETTTHEVSETSIIVWGYTSPDSWHPESGVSWLLQMGGVKEVLTCWQKKVESP